MNKQDMSSGVDATTESVVPAYPYDDALLSLFHNSIVDAGGRAKRRNGSITYNRDLFLPGTEYLHGRAAAIAVLFENIILAPRSVELPDIETYTKEGGYSHPDLRLRMPFEAPPQFGKYVGWIGYGDEDGAGYGEGDFWERLAIDPRTQNPIGVFSHRHKRLFPDLTYLDFTINTVAQAYLARKHNAVLLGNEVFREFYELLLTEAP